MPGQHTNHDVVITWFPIREIAVGREELDRPVCVEQLPRRRTWTTIRDLADGSTDQEVWRQPTPQEWAAWQLSEPQPGQLDDSEVAWMVATTGEPGLGVPTRMAVRLQELLVRQNESVV